MPDTELTRIAEALERLSPPPPPLPDFEAASVFLWEKNQLHPVPKMDKINIDLLVGIDKNRDILLSNTQRFAEGFSANNALLWGARGTGKSSLVKAVHDTLHSRFPNLRLIEIPREDLPEAATLLRLLRRASEKRFVLFCDDLSFEQSDPAYKSLKAILDGGVEGRAENVLFYATSNRRHLMPRDMSENQRGADIAATEAAEEKISLSDRFGLWLGFYACSQDAYLEMIQGYCTAYGVKISPQDLRSEAIEWQMTRGGRSGRVAWQYFIDLAGRKGIQIT